MDFYAVLDKGLIIAFAALCVAAAHSDLRTRKIPNSYSIAIALLYPAHVIVSGAQTEWLQALAVAAGCMAVGIFVFARGWLGAGDVKLMSATLLWAVPDYLPGYLWALAILSGLMSIFLLLRRHFRAAPSPSEGPSEEVSETVAKELMPFGLAISAAGLYVAFTLLV